MYQKWNLRFNDKENLDHFPLFMLQFITLYVNQQSQNVKQLH